MANRIVLDSNPLSLLCHTNKDNPASIAINAWVVRQLQDGGEIFIAEIADYEVRRELLRCNKLKALQRLDEAARLFTYLPITTEVIRMAATQWASARQAGKGTCDPKALDGDVILASQAIFVGAMIATDNVGHLGQFVTAKPWHEIE